MTNRTAAWTEDRQLAETQEIGPAEQALLRSSLISQTPLIDDQQLAETQEIGPEEQASLRTSLTGAWLSALQAAEAMHVCLDPSYRRHSDSELFTLVHASLMNRRNPSQMIAELVAGAGIPQVTLS